LLIRDRLSAAVDDHDVLNLGWDTCLDQRNPHPRLHRRLGSPIAELKRFCNVRATVRAEVLPPQRTNGVEIDIAAVREGVEGDHALDEARGPAREVGRPCVPGW
jgi:isocitrate/isopropylmalate dehydrogenase